MKRWLPIVIFTLVAVDSGGSPSPVTTPENLVAWCIVPYDNQARTPAQRVAMLRRLGLTQYAWDRRAEHVAQLPQELAAADAAGVRVRAVWLWIDGRHDAPGRLADANRFIIDTVRRDGRPMEYWVGFHENFYADLADAARVRKGAEMVAWLRDEVGSQGTVLLYNHLDWFGEPDNQLRIIAAAGTARLGLVYNFHHAHAQLDRFADFLPRMLPYLRCVTLNGLKPDGPKILPVGAGTHERELVGALVRAGLSWSVGDPRPRGASRRGTGASREPRRTPHAGAALSRRRRQACRR